MGQNSSKNINDAQSGKDKSAKRQNIAPEVEKTEVKVVLPEVEAGVPPFAKASTIMANSIVPDWLTKDYFKGLISAEKSDFKEIQNYSITKGSEAGDNYSSSILSVDIDYKTSKDQIASASYMLKVPPTGSMAKALLDLMQAFEKEMAIYHDVIPQLEQLFEQSSQPIKLAPKNYKFEGTTDSKYILLQNMRPAGYKNADRLQGLTKPETEQVLIKLAKFHAASAQLYVTKGPYADCLDKPLHNEATRPIFDGEECNSYLKVFINSIGTFKNFEVFGDKLTYFADNNFDLTAKAEDYDETQFNCLNHGDCWTNNILFAYNGQGEIKDTLLIDYQRACFGSPSRDLYYLLLSSPNFDIKINEFDYFVRFYHNELERNLKLLQYPRQIPSLEDLQANLLRNSYWAVSTVATVMPVVLLDPTDNDGIDSFLGNDEKSLDFKKKLFQNERFRKHAQAVYLWMNQKGLMNFD